MFPLGMKKMKLEAMNGEKSKSKRRALEGNNLSSINDESPIILKHIISGVMHRERDKDGVHL